MAAWSFSCPEPHEQLGDDERRAAVHQEERRQRGWGGRLRHRAVTGDRDGPQESWTKLERECVCYLTKKVIVRTRNKNQP